MNQFGKRILLSFVFGLVLGSVLVSAKPRSKPSASPTPSPSPAAAAVTDDDHYLREGLKGMAEDSKTLVGWCLALIGGSIVAIASTSYLRPARRLIRSMYLLFIPGWMLIAVSIYYGDRISRRYTATTFAQKRDLLLQIGSQMNTEFDAQLTYFHRGLIVFSIWLVAFTIWWVFGRSPVPTSAKSGETP